MIDPGRPFSVPFESLIHALEDRVRNGVEQPAERSFIFKRNVTSYELSSAAYAITRVTGLVNQQFRVFAPVTDYNFSGDRLVWVNPLLQPDDGSRLDVEFTYREPPPGITDFNPGSVIGTLIRAVARELKLLYEQMDEAYRRAFIDQASGVALDAVVALLGVTRKEPVKAVGSVTFMRKTPPPRTIQISKGTRVADQAGHIFVTIDDATIAPTTPSLSTTVAVEAADAGPQGNVNAGTITIMPTPPPGVDGVSNENATHDGQSAEADDRLRDRARHALERAGNATLNAIRFAVLEVEGVEGVEVIDRSTDDSIPPGEVRVRYSGGKIEDVRRAVELSRAAGVIARLEQIVEVVVAGVFYLIPAVEAPPASSIATFLSSAAGLIAALPIGAPLQLRRINSLVFELPGLADVAEPQLNFKKPDPAQPGNSIEGIVVDPLLIAPTEVIRSETGGLTAAILKSIRIPAAHKTAARTFTIDVELSDSGNTPVIFRSFSLNLNVVIRAFLINNPDAPPERLANFTRVVQFAGSSRGALSIQPGDLTSFRASDHKPELEFVVTAAAYPALSGVTAVVNIS